MNTKILVRDVIKITKAEMIQGNLEQECYDFAYDTRQMNPNDVYIGLKTEKSDGSYYWQEAFKKGANIVIIN